MDKRIGVCSRKADGAVHETFVGGPELEPIGTKTRTVMSVSACKDGGQGRNRTALHITDDSNCRSSAPSKAGVEMTCLST
jgi:hypothetical protein